MSVLLTEKLNTLPRLSNRWLKINHHGFSGSILLPSKPYGKNFLPDLADGKILLEKIQNAQVATLVPAIKYGVSDQAVKLAEEHSNGGFFLEIPRAHVQKEPIHIKYHLDDLDPVLYDHNLIIAGENSSATVVIEFFGDQGEFYHNGVTKIFAEKGAQITIIKVQRLSDSSVHLDSNYTELGSNSGVRHVQVELGSKKSITNYLARIGVQSKALVDSMYLGSGERTLDLSYHMIHTGYRSASNVLVKGVLKDKAKKVFRGTLDFKRGAHLADGNEEEYVLLLDPTVKSDAVPLLLSEEDDVLGGHAASAGKIDPKDLFYLMSRGLSIEEATLVLIKASYQPVLDLLPLNLRQSILEDLHQRLVI